MAIEKNKRKVYNKKEMKKAAQIEKIKYVYWEDNQMWIGYLKEFPDYLTQGGTFEKLKDNLIDIYKELTGGTIPCLRKGPEL